MATGPTGWAGALRSLGVLALHLVLLSGAWFAVGKPEATPTPTVAVRFIEQVVTVPPPPPVLPPPRRITPAAPVLTAAAPAAAPAPFVVAPQPETPSADAAPAAAEPSPPAAPPLLSAPRFDAAYLNNPAPSYPPLARRFGEQGQVLLRVRVSAQGLPEHIELQRSSGFARLDEAARRAVEQWRFVAARQGNEAVAAWVLVPLSFRLD